MEARLEYRSGFPAPGGGTISVATMSNTRAIPLSLELVQLSEGVFEIAGALGSAFAAMRFVQAGAPLHTAIVDGGAVGRGITSLAKAIGGADVVRWMKAWLTGVEYQAPGGQVYQLADSGFDAVPKAVLEYGIFYSIRENTRDFFGTADGQESGPGAVLTMLRESTGALKEFSELWQRISQKPTVEPKSATASGTEPTGKAGSASETPET